MRKLKFATHLLPAFQDASRCQADAVPSENSHSDRTTTHPHPPSLFLFSSLFKLAHSIDITNGSDWLRRDSISTASCSGCKGCRPRGVQQKRFPESPPCVVRRNPRHPRPHLGRSSLSQSIQPIPIHGASELTTPRWQVRIRHPSPIYSRVLLQAVGDSAAQPRPEIYPTAILTIPSRSGLVSGALTYHPLSVRC